MTIAKATVTTIQAEGETHPVRLARYASDLDRWGQYSAAFLARGILVMQGRCALCGRRLTSRRTRNAVVGRSCAR